MSLYDTIEATCIGCGRKVSLPAGRVKKATRDQRYLPVFCSRACNLRHVAKTGAKQQHDQQVRNFDVS